MTAEALAREAFDAALSDREKIAAVRDRLASLIMGSPGEEAMLGEEIVHSFGIVSDALNKTTAHIVELAKMRSRAESSRQKSGEDGDDEMYGEIGDAYSSKEEAN